VNSQSVLPWILLAVWSAWLHAVQGIWGASSPFAPDLGVVLLIALAARVQTHDLPLIGLSLAVGRLAVSVDPPAAVLAGTLGLTALVRGLRAGVEVGGPLPRTLLAAVSTVLLAAWLGFVHDFHAAREAAVVAPGLEGLSNVAVHWRAATTSAGVSLLFGPALARLPGLSPLRKRRGWQLAASGR
jgi:hypothetical protein